MLVALYTWAEERLSTVSSTANVKRDSVPTFPGGGAFRGVAAALPARLAAALPVTTAGLAAEPPAFFLPFVVVDDEEEEAGEGSEGSDAGARCSCGTLLLLLLLVPPLPRAFFCAAAGLLAAAFFGAGGGAIFSVGGTTGSGAGESRGRALRGVTMSRTPCWQDTWRRMTSPCCGFVLCADASEGDAAAVPAGVVVAAGAGDGNGCGSGVGVSEERACA